MPMSESTKAALAASVAVGYMLGRGRKAKLAMTVAAYLASRKLQAKPQELLAAGVGKLGESPEVAQLVEQVRGEVLNVGREALKALADRRLGTFADALAERTRSLGQAVDAAQERAEEREAEEEGEEEEGEEGGERAEETEAETDRSGPRRAPNRTRPRRPRRDSEVPSAPARKTSQKTAGNAPPRKSAKKKTARKPPAESTSSRR